MTIPPLPTSLTLEIVTPERLLVRDQVDEVEVPGAEGYFGVLPGHTPLLATLQIGELWYRKSQERNYLFIAFGFAEILPDRVTILTRIAEKAEEVDVVRAQSARDRAVDRLTGRPQIEIDFERARISLMKSLMRLQVAERARTRV